MRVSRVTHLFGLDCRAIKKSAHQPTSYLLVRLRTGEAPRDYTQACRRKNCRIAHVNNKFVPLFKMILSTNVCRWAGLAQIQGLEAVSDALQCRDCRSRCRSKLPATVTLFICLKIIKIRLSVEITIRKLVIV